MQRIREIIIVEGQHDINRLKLYLDAEFIKTDGSSLPKETKQRIENLAKQGKDFIILTDPDYPGEKIRNELLKIIPNAKQAFVRKEMARTSKKVGVEHAEKEEIERALSQLISFEDYSEKFTLQDLYGWGLAGQADSEQRRDVVCRFYSLGKANAKTFLKRLNALNYTEKDLRKSIDELLHR